VYCWNEACNLTAPFNSNTIGKQAKKGAAVTHTAAAQSTEYRNFHLSS
jgi:hypothetical protein